MWQVWIQVGALLCKLRHNFTVRNLIPLLFSWTFFFKLPDNSKFLLLERGGLRYKRGLLKWTRKKDQTCRPSCIYFVGGIKKQCHIGKEHCKIKEEFGEWEPLKKPSMQPFSSEWHHLHPRLGTSCTEVFRRTYSLKECSKQPQIFSFVCF